MEPYKENVIEWIQSGRESHSIPHGSPKGGLNPVNLKSWRAEPGTGGRCELLARNKDGSIFAHVPISWVKIGPPREVSEEQRRQAKERMEAMRADGLLSKSSTGENR